MVPEDSKNISSIEILLNSFRNKTKLAIISLLLMNGKMTVTNMSRFLHTTRSNLYQAVKELRNDGIIKLSESRVVKNYVEKYYILNNELFEGITNGDLTKAIGDLDASGIKELFISYLVASSITLSAIAEDLKDADDRRIMSYRDKYEKTLIMSLSTLSEESLKKFSHFYHGFVDEVQEKSLAGQETEDVLLMVFSFPLKKL